MAARGSQAQWTIPTEVVIAGAVSLLLSILFWGDLWAGGGLIGGDLYSYFFPQKKYYCDHLQRGEIALWNNLTGHGYPVLGESQTGALYPFNLVCFYLFDVNTAYNAVQIAHYLLAFVFTWLYARSMNLSAWGAGLAALIYTYGWFPARICLEWAIVGGAWFPLAMWGSERFLQTGRWRSMGVMIFALAMQLFPGHYNLAFITQLTLIAYVPLRLWFARGGLTEQNSRLRVRNLTFVFAAIVCAFGLAAVQWLPSWELKQVSQRAEFGGEGSPAYGHLPFWYLVQVVAPWLYWDRELDLNAWIPSGAPLTNRVEAHLYFGLLSLVLAVWAFARGLPFRDRRLLVWTVMGLVALSYTFGWYLPVAQHVPGFNFFRGEGRFGLVTTLAMALLAGAGLGDLCARLSSWPRFTLGAAAFLITTCDLWNFGPQMSTSVIVSKPPVNVIAASPVRKELNKYPAPVRLFSRGPNLPTLLGFASTPVYLGLSPGVYYDPKYRMPGKPPYDEPATPEQIDWLRRAGVTHVLSFIPLDRSAWPAKLVWASFDPFLNYAWARSETIYLYEFLGGRGRVTWDQPGPENRASVQAYGPHRVEIDAESANGGRLILTDLAYPGWNVTIDGQPAAALTVEKMYRAVEVPAGNHTVVWSYAPRSVTYGAAISVATLLLLAAVAHIRFWHPGWITRIGL